MTQDLKSVLFDRLPDDKFAKPQLDRNEKPVDWKQFLHQSLAKPLYYPPLSEAVFAGDQVAVVLQNGLPRAPEILSALLQQLFAVGISPADVIVVVSQQMASQLPFGDSPNQDSEPRIELLSCGDQQIRGHIHDADNESSVAYLVANEAGDPVHMNRLLCDADVVLPVGFSKAGGAYQQIDCLYPEFASAAVKRRFAHEEGSFLARHGEIELANNSLGSFFSIQFVFGPGDQVRHVVCGARKDACDLARLETNKLWEFDWPENVQTVVATIESNAMDQTWDDFAQALIAASDLSIADGPIIVWSEIAQKPGRRIRKACQSQFEEGISAKLSKELQHLAAVIKERPVYLRSRLSRNEVEDLGIGFVESADDINRIVESHDTGLLLRDAQKCQVQRRSLENSV